MHRTRSIFFLAPLGALAVSLAPAARAQSNDSILSRHIREADGTTVQDTNTGSGVKTGHLQNGAVTAPKLAPAAVGTAALADGAVTAGKLAGAIPAAKIDRTGLDADTLDGRHAADFSLVGHAHDAGEIQGLGVFRKKSRNVIVVAKDGSGDFADPSAAVASIADASASNPYVVKVMPGRYDLAAPVALSPYVDLEGSGRGTTVLHGGGAAIVAARSVVSAVYGNSEVRDLTVESDGVYFALFGSGRFTNLDVVAGGTLQNGDHSVGIYINAGEIRNARITVRPAAGAGWAQGIAVSGDGVVVSDVDVTVQGNVGWSQVFGYYGAQGMYVDYNRTPVVLRNARFDVTGDRATMAIGPGAVDARGVTLKVAATGNVSAAVGFAVTGSSSISGCDVNAGPAGLAIQIPAHPATVSVAHTQVVGQIIGVSTWTDARFQCIGNYDATLAPVSCP